jgi:hypothetical protein
MEPVAKAMKTIEEFMKQGEWAKAEGIADEMLKHLGGDPRTQDMQNPEAQRIQKKMQRIHQVIQTWQKEGRNLDPIAKTMERFEPLIKAGKIREAESILDDVLKKIAGESQKSDQMQVPHIDQKINWVKDLDAAMLKAREQKKLVMQFLMLGDLTAEDC